MNTSTHLQFPTLTAIFNPSCSQTYQPQSPHLQRQVRFDVITTPQDDLHSSFLYRDDHFHGYVHSAVLLKSRASWLEMEDDPLKTREDE